MNKVQAAKTIIKLAKALATDSKSTRTAGAKYTLTDENISCLGHTVYRVKYADGTLGGFIESEKNLQGNAKVLDESCVIQDAVVKDNAIVTGGSFIGGNAIISGRAKVQHGDIYDDVVVTDNAQVEGGEFSDSACVSGYAKVINGCYLEQNAKVSGHAVVNNSSVVHSAIVNGNAKVSGLSVIGETTQVSGVVKKSAIGGKIRVEGTVIGCRLTEPRTVEKNETLKNIKEGYFMI